jgi:hypothetical protein
MLHMLSTVWRVRQVFINYAEVNNETVNTEHYSNIPNIKMAQRRALQIYSITCKHSARQTFHYPTNTATKLQYSILTSQTLTTTQQYLTVTAHPLTNKQQYPIETAPTLIKIRRYPITKFSWAISRVNTEYKILRFGKFIIL